MSGFRLRTNALASALQVLCTGLLLLVLYRYLVRWLGKEQVGVWSVVLATVSTSRITELGLAGSVVKFVASHRVAQNLERAAIVVETAFVTIFAALLLLVLSLSPVFLWILQKILPAGEAIVWAQDIFVFALATLILNSLGSLVQGGLDGMQQIVARSSIGASCGALFFGLAFVLVPKFGLRGLALAQLIQAFTLLSVSYLWLRRHLPLRVLPVRWRWPALQEMLHYGLNYQVATLSSFLIEPTTKVLLSRLGGLEVVAYFEVANRVTTQTRALLVSGNRAVVPHVVELSQNGARAIEQFFAKSYATMFWIAVSCFSGLLVLLPSLSHFWFSELDQTFLIMACILILGWSINTLAAPIYYINLGRGRLAWNTVTHVWMGLANAGLGLLGGLLFGGLGVIGGWCIAIVSGSLLLNFSGLWDLRLSPSLLLLRNQRRLLFAVSLLVAMLVVIWNGFADIFAHNFWQSLIAGGILWSLLLAPWVWWTAPFRTPSASASQALVP